MPLGQVGKKGICVRAIEDGDEVYEFERGGDGYIFAYRTRPRKGGNRRVLANELPTSALRAAFVQLTGKTAAEIGVTGVEHH